MADNYIKTANQLEAVIMATSLPRNDAIASLLNEGRQSTFSAHGSVDATDPHKIVLKISESGLPAITLNGYAGDAQINIAKSGQTVSDHMDFGDADKQFVGRIESNSIFHPESNTSETLMRATDAAGKAAVSEATSSQIAAVESSDSLALFSVANISDAKGNSHRAVEATRTSLSEHLEISDLFVLKDTFQPKLGATVADVPFDQIVGVVHQVETGEGKTNFEINVQPPRPITFPAPERSL